MKYFMPDWEDKVDPKFDFHADLYTPERDVSADVYAHEIFSQPPYDGLLVSRAVVEKSQRNYEALKARGARQYLRLPDALEVFGDCGAFSYVDEYTPWYETHDVIDYYDTIGVNYGVSVDHLVVPSTYVDDVNTEGVRAKRKKPMSEAESRRRVELTLANAGEFLGLHQARHYRFTPVGAAQGWSPESYASSVDSLLRMGYSYIALGGLARSPARQVLDVLRAARKAVEDARDVVSNRVRFHLFGVAKLSLLKELPKYGVASIDSASYLRKAWLRSGQNYLGADEQWYTAVRVPQSHNVKVQHYVSTNGKSMAQVRDEESYCLQMLERYGNHDLGSGELEQLIDILVEYDTYLLRAGDDGQSLRDQSISRERYLRTLEARPWESCPCEICRELGIHVLIFRGTNRNKRRGFHNTWTFYRRLTKAVDEHRASSGQPQVG